jgi:Icc-related predicted phosphoesterase
MPKSRKYYVMKDSPSITKKTQVLCISVADIHGNKIQYEKLLRLVGERRISYVFLCGDILPKDGGSWSPDNKIRTIAMQADFINSYFLDYLRRLGTVTQVYAIFGNDDFRSNYHTVEQAHIPNVHFLNNAVTSITLPDQVLSVAGYPYIGLTPFQQKDWEKWDTIQGEMPYKIYRDHGFSSKSGVHYPVDFIHDPDRQSTLRDDLAHLSKLSDPKKTIYVFHEAPFDTPLDMIAPDNPYIKDGQLHIGSTAIREFIDTQQPLLTMHGHIHETFQQSGTYTWTSGSSMSITPSNDFLSDQLSYVLFTLPDMGHIERLQI